MPNDISSNPPPIPQAPIPISQPGVNDADPTQGAAKVKGATEQLQAFLKDELSPAQLKELQQFVGEMGQPRLTPGTVNSPSGAQLSTLQTQFPVARLVLGMLTELVEALAPHASPQAVGAAASPGAAASTQMAPPIVGLLLTEILAQGMASLVVLNTMGGNSQAVTKSSPAADGGAGGKSQAAGEAGRTSVSTTGSENVKTNPFLAGSGAIAFAVAMMEVGRAEKQMTADYSKRQLEVFAAMRDVLQSQLDAFQAEADDTVKMNQEMMTQQIFSASTSLVAAGAGFVAVTAGRSKAGGDLMTGMGQAANSAGQAWGSAIQASHQGKIIMDRASQTFFQTMYSNMEGLRKQLLDFVGSNQQNIDSVYSQLSRWQDALSQSIKYTV